MFKSLNSYQGLVTSREESMFPNTMLQPWNKMNSGADKAGGKVTSSSSGSAVVPAATNNFLSIFS